MKKERYTLPAVGGSSLLTIFAVLCLTVLALLSLSTVLAEKRLSDAAAEAASAYFEADLKAQEILARLRNGETVPGVKRQEENVMYTVPVSRHQTLMVELEQSENGWKILRWQTVAQPEEHSQALPVWEGNTEGGKHHD